MGEMGNRKKKKKPKKKVEEKATCSSCKKELLKKDMIYGEDPFSSEVYNDKKRVWLCESCHYESGRDV